MRFIKKSISKKCRGQNFASIINIMDGTVNPKSRATKFEKSYLTVWAKFSKYLKLLNKVKFKV